MKRKMISLLLGLSLCSMAWAQSYVEDSVKVQGHMRKFVMYLVHPAGPARPEGQDKLERRLPLPEGMED